MVKLSSPKQSAQTMRGGKGTWYPYYAGYSADFLRDMLDILALPASQTLLDPWLGTGTTVAEASRRGLRGIGLDLNPVMVVVSKARLLGQEVAESLVPLALDLIDEEPHLDVAPDDPLALWFKPRAAGRWRGLARAIARVLLREARADLTDPENVSKISSLAAFYYVALFRAVRRQLGQFSSSNPTWVRVPREPHRRLSPSWSKISVDFLEAVTSLMKNLQDRGVCTETQLEVSVQVGDARKMKMAPRSVDAIVASPPYCTRIDYAVATLPELSVLGFRYKHEFRALREVLTGSTAIRPEPAQLSESWGPACTSFLKNVESHPSHGSRRYYFPQFVQYFSDLSGSLSEIARVTRSGGSVVLVIQDSSYKDLHVDLPWVVTQMASVSGLDLVKCYNFTSERSMRTINPNARKSRAGWKPTEAVLHFVVA